MIRHIDTYRDNQARYIRNNNNRSKEYFVPDHDQLNSVDLHKYDHLVPPMKRVLKFTARATWFMMKTLVKAAWHLPGLFRKTAAPSTAAKKKNPSPDSAFPSP